MNFTSQFATPLALDPQIDADACARRFAADGHIRIPHVLGAGAPDLYRYLEYNQDWMQLIKKPQGGAYEIPLRDWERPGSRRRSRIEREMYANACDGFQYSYAALRVPSPGEACGDPMLNQISSLLDSPAVKATLARIVGIENPRFTDGQVTAYSPGDFLTGHDDDLPGAGRVAAFVLGLTPQWRLEWGGLLMFHELGEVPFSGLCPQFNTLDLFAVPKYHSVSLVSRAAPRRRYAITGWLSCT